MAILTNILICTAVALINLMLCGLAAFCMHKLYCEFNRSLESYEKMTNLRLDLLTKKIVELEK